MATNCASGQILQDTPIAPCFEELVQKELGLRKCRFFARRTQTALAGLALPCGEALTPMLVDGPGRKRRILETQGP